MANEPMTPREAWEKMQETGDISPGMGAVNAAFAKAILRRQANVMRQESCVISMEESDPGAEPWTVSLVLTDGKLSAEGCNTLAKMRSNAHRAELVKCPEGGLEKIIFYVYTKEVE